MTDPSTDSAAGTEINGPEITRPGPDHSPATTRPADQSLLQSKTAILAILFLGTGALGIPLLWTSQRFSNKERFLWAAITTLYSLSLLLFLGWFIFWLKAQVMG